MPRYDQEELAYFEYRAVNQLRTAHRQVHGEALRAIIVFGKALTSPYELDLHILEVVEGWTGLDRWVASGSPELAARGRLFFYFLTPEEFESGNHLLLDQVREAYAIVYESPDDYAEQVIAPKPNETFRSFPQGGKSAHFARC